MPKIDIIIIGAGAAGLMAAGRAAELGARVKIIEHKSKPGRKLSITGKGRCNLTNSVELAEFINHFHPNGRFLRPSFSLFFSKETIDFFLKQKVPTTIERGGRVFPLSNKAQDVVNALVNWNLQHGVKIETNTVVDALLLEDNRIKGVKIRRTKNRKGKIVKIGQTSCNIHADAVILATGGASYPATGSTGDGYNLARSVGHSIIIPRPALVPLETKNGIAETLRELSLKNVSVSLWIDGKKKDTAFGEMTFTDFGLTGPVILTLSHQVVDNILENRQVIIKIDLKPALDAKKLDARLLRELDRNGKKQFLSVLGNLLPKKMISYCVDELGIQGDKPCHQIGAVERKCLRQWLKEIPFLITGYRPFSEAIITAGGIRLQEVNPKTMASRKIERLFFAGEVLDIQADTGGYNLQAAFSTGRLAAESAITKN